MLLLRSKPQAAYGGWTVRKQAVEQVKSEGKVIHAGTVRIYNNERREEGVNQASLKQVQDQDRNITTTQNIKGQIIFSLRHQMFRANKNQDRENLNYS